MADRKCSLCGEIYTDESGHDYDKCVGVLERRVDEIGDLLMRTKGHLISAKSTQKQPWWRNNA